MLISQPEYLNIADIDDMDNGQNVLSYESFAED